MIPELQAILDEIRRSENLSESEKESLAKSVKDADKAQGLSQFKLGRLEKDKTTLTIMLQESIEDLQKKSRAIEAQNRELEIEASLEKVRAVAMGIRKRDDMLDVCRTISQQLEALGIREIRNVQTAIFYEQKGTYVNYEYYRLHDKALVTEVDYTSDEISVEFATQMIKGGDKIFIRRLEGQQVKDWLDFQKTTNVFIDTNLEKAKSLTYHWFSLGPVAIGTSTYEPLREIEIELFKRFRNVFELAYRRYIDIEKAEAQAREANIEAALEKVRSKANAMHRSENLREVITEVHTQLRHLEFRFDSADFLTDYTDKGYNIWLATADPSIPSPIFVPYLDHRIFHLLNEEVRQGNEFFTFQLTQEEKNSYFKHVFQTALAKYEHRESRHFVLSSQGMATSCVVLKNIILSITNFASIPYTEEENNVIKRFAYVFEQSYIRFLDLQKAEAQARESQIQLALERVRARTMAMHNSHELAEVASLLFEQVKQLGVETYASGFNIWDKEHKNLVSWMSNPTGSINPPFEMPIHGYDQHVRIYQSWKNHESFIEDDLTGEALARHYKFLRSFPLLDEAFSRSEKAGIKTPGRQVHNNAHFSNGYLLFITSEPRPEAHDIFKRFAQVFDQTYTRFLDLQKAEAQARESQIELGLERVRARAMAMQRSDELNELIGTVSEELGKLDFALDRSIIGIIDQQTLGQTWWMSHPESPSPVGLFLKYHEHKPYLAQLNAWRERQLKFQYILEGEIKKEWDKFLFVETELSQLPEIVIATMRSKEKVYLSSSFNNFGYLSVATLDPLSDDQFDILLRFAKVFDLTYTRFNDLKQAEAQTREAQIQLALERVRARTMAMQKSDELLEVVATLYEQLSHLQFDSNACNIIIIDKETNNQQYWVSGFNQKLYPESYNVPYFKHPYLDLQLQSWKQGDRYIVIEYSGKAKQEFDKEFFSQTEFKNIPQEVQKVIKALESARLSTAFFTYGALQIIGPDPLDNANAEILQRFAGVFEQAYTRFLDLQKAEAQAREGHIQLALERVRARTMAMQRSEELSEAVYVLFQQFRELGENPDQATIGIVNEEEGVIEYWVTMYGNQIDRVFKFSIDERHVTNKIYKGWKEGKRSLIIDLTGEDLIEFATYRERMGGAKLNPGEKQRIINVAFFSKGLLNVQSTQTRSGESIRLLERFAAVFDQTYTRFLDLKNAEAQAKESQIQLALERVRARTMAMQRSNELADVAKLLFRQVKELGITAWTTGFNIWQVGNTSYIDWVTDPTGEFLEPYTVDTTIHPVFGAIREARQRGDDFFVSVLEGQEIKETYELLNRFGEKGQFQKMIDSGVQFPSRQINHVVFGSQVSLLFITYEPCPEAWDIFKRFGKVFEQTYTRFLDLQKAEEQAREGQIQLALERVRARTMAMQKSDELADVAELLFKQVNDLGIKTWTTGFNVWSDDNNFYTDYITNPQGGFMSPYTIDASRWPVSIELSNAKKRGEEFRVNYEEGEELAETYRQLSTFGEKQFKSIADSGFEFPSHQYEHFVFGSKVSLMFITYDPVPEAHDIFKRFGKVFEQTYTRFLDLQKAEEQAREAQIEAALEKIRSRSLAMHKSNELKDVINVVFEKLRELHLEFDGAGLQLFTEGAKDAILWIRGVVLSSPVLVNHPYEKEFFENSEIFKDIWRAREKSEPVFNKTYSFTEKNKLVDYTGRYNQGNGTPPEVIEAMYQAAGYTATFIMEKNSGLWIDSWSGKKITLEELNVSKRVAKVFEQAYIRFLDLQKAEAQGREAQIEAALEKVRSRTMGMQHSNELRDASSIMFQQIKTLGVQQFGCGFNIWDEDRKAATAWMSGDDRIQSPFKTSSSEDIFLHIYAAAQRGESLFVKEQGGDELVTHYKYMASIPGFKEIMDNMSQAGSSVPSFQIIHCAFFSQGYLMFITYEPVPQMHDIFKRFAKVFEQTYTRFLDLQKAEAQGREAQIEAALEKVRSRSLAMHKSDELQEVVHTVFERLRELNVQLYTAIIIIFKKDSKDIVWWMQNKVNQQYSRILIRYADIQYLKDLFETRESGKELFSKCYVGEEKYELYNYLFEHTDLKNVPADQKKFLLENEFASISVAFAKNTAIHLTSYSERSFSDEDHEILKRFAKVFDQAYTRFLDLQKAEAQAREAQIEAALERVRAKAMAMHKADDLNPAVAIVFEELDKLNLGMLRCGIGILHKEKRSVDVWSTSISDEKTTMQISGDESIDIHPLLQGAFDAWLNKTDFSYTLQGEDLLQYYKAVGATNIRLPQAQTGVNTQYYYVVSFGAGGLFAFRESEFSEEGKTVMKRFANVFNLTYKRFLDLQKAEAQAREGQIQLALERARAQSMIMQHSKELDDTLRVFHEQVLQLNIPSAFSFLWLPDEEKDRHIFWAAWAENNSFKSKDINYPLDKNEPATAQCLVDWKSNKPVVAYHVPPAGVENYFVAWNELIAGVEQLKPGYFSDGLYYVEAFMKYGCFGVMVKHPLHEDENKILERFAIEFERAYTRFLDLQKAEGQAREAEIELALERVRARAMSMQTSEELNALIGTVFAELTKLDLVLTRCVILIYEGNEKGIRWWMANSEAPSIPMNFFVKYADMPFFNEYLNAWSNRTLKWQYVLEGENKVKTDAFLFKETELSRLPDFVVAGMRAPDRVYLNASFNNFGNLTLASLAPLSNEHFDILLRFAKVFDLTYTRFNDLKQAEAQAREARIEAALERVRSRTLAMQRSDELAETASVLFRQLIFLGIEPNRLFINIIKNENGEAEFWVTDEEGSKVSTAYTSNLRDNLSFKKMYDGWKEQRKSLSIDIQGKELEEFFKHLASLDVPFTRGKRRLEYIAYFAKGFIGMASPDEQPPETMQLLERFAAVFNLTFTRFNDLKIAEAHALKAEQDLIEIKAARKNAEEALVELQATQRQLIQSEKMASLGELTAGIAHEIQNPLNFVNNFSDVSNELLDEMKTELEKGNTKDAVSIVDDVKQNLEKILYHGKRADAIVKGMLQHSRTSGSQKELTDINALADEYLRLAYHGLRAKDKSFNAKFNTDFDTTAGKVNIIPQEIGRVILNLINNAFYTVSEKQKGSNGGFEPTVAVSTKKEADSIVITVADNGNGIPKKNLDKIFQPFFTTKPTGQGTGLGLSLAYDIVTKGHNGEIKIETNEGEGSKFIVIIPSIQQA